MRRDTPALALGALLCALLCALPFAGHAADGATAPSKRDTGASTPTTPTAPDELEQSFDRLKAETQAWRLDARGHLERRFDAARRRVRRDFERQLSAAETRERAQREDAIALFEAFLARHPDDPRYTPDAMTRLAELHYEKGVDEQQQALAAYEERAKFGTDEAAPDGQRSFTRPIALYRDLLTKFPDYRLAGTVMSLLGWCLGEEGRIDEARAVYAGLVERFPKSPHVAEAWVRLGEFDFEEAGDDGAADKTLRRAADAYGHAVQFRDSPLYDKALYKLGWTWYRLNELTKAVDAFVDLVDHYERLRLEGRDGGGDLRAEALQYTAVSFTDDAWVGVERRPDGGERFLGVEKLRTYLQSRGGRPWEDELYRKLADALFDATRFEAAVEAWRLVLERKPAAPDAPKTQERIVQALGRAGRREEAIAARQKLIETYAANGAWAAAQGGDGAALRLASELVEKSLLQTAQFHHRQAQEDDKAAEAQPKGSPAREQATRAAFAAYQAAAKAYGDYLSAYPHTKGLYDITYLHAETLYRSLRFAEAAEAYRRVRDDAGESKYFAQAAYAVVLSLQREVERQEAAGTLEARRPCTPERCKDLADLAPRPLAEPRRRLVAAADFFVSRQPVAPEAPLLALKSSQTFLAAFQFDEGRRRAEELIRRYPDTEAAQLAYEELLAAAIVQKDWARVEAVADRMLDGSDAVKGDAKEVERLRLAKYGARFERASDAMRQKRWQDAAEMFLAIVDDSEHEKGAGPWEKADAALYNAALCLRERRRFDSAMRAYERLYKDYPKSPLAERALFFVAENAEKAFAYDKAVDGYLKLFKDYPQSKDRVAALFNAAKLLEALQRYREAADAYRLYARTFEAEPDAPDMAFQASVLAQRTKDWKGLVSGLEAFVRQFERRTDQSEKVIQAWRTIGLAWRAQKQEKKAQEAWRSCVAEFDRRRMGEGNALARSAAAECAFLLTEQKWADFQALKFDPKGKGPKLEQSMKEGLELVGTRLEEAKAAYGEVIVKYQWPEWMMAALLRLGNLDEESANKLLNSPCPAEVKAIGGEDACAEYRVQLEERVAPIMEQAQGAYEKAQEKSIELRVSNSWTKLANEKVCQLSPAKCVSLKDPRSRLMSTDQAPRPLARDVRGIEPVIYPSNEAAQRTVVDDVQPRRAAAGDVLTVTGAHFASDVAALTVTIGASTLAVLQASTRELQVQLPPGTATGPLTVTTARGRYTTPFVVELGAEAATEGIGAAPTMRAPQSAGADAVQTDGEAP